LWARVDSTSSRQISYTVTEVGSGERGVWQCDQCLSVLGGSPAWPAGFCSWCGAARGMRLPALVLAEALAPEHFGAAFEVLAETGGRPAHPALRVPVAAFVERVARTPRYCVVAPAVQALPASAERTQVLAWAPALAGGLAYLHGLGLAFAGQFQPGDVALADGRAVWARLPGLPEGELASAQSSDVRALAEWLHRWLTGQAQIAPDAALDPPVAQVFAHALALPGFATAAELAQALEQAQRAAATQPAREVRVGRATHVGRVRKINEDSLLTLEVVRVTQSRPQPVSLLAVADGMGGQSAGEVASATLVSVLSQRALADLGAARLTRPDFDFLAWLRELVVAANAAVLDRRRAAGNNMGSTLVLAGTDGQSVYVAHVGDSRAYLVNVEGVRRLTTDHSLVERLVAVGQLTQAQARQHGQRNVIYRTMGDRANVEMDLSTQALAAGDRLLLCSDGLSGLVDDAQIQQIVMSAPPQAACEALIAAANAAGGDDNITAVVAEIVELPAPA
jgi:protein phosphatase